MVVFVLPTTEATINCMEIAIITKKEESVIGQVKRQGNV
jgi:hypothetical protein